MAKDENKIFKPKPEEEPDNLLVEIQKIEDTESSEDEELSTAQGPKEEGIRTHDHDGQNSKEIKIRNLSGMFEIVSAVPTHKPTKMYDQIKLYYNGGTIRIYWYDYIAKTWRYVS